MLPLYGQIDPCFERLDDNNVNLPGKFLLSNIKNKKTRHVQPGFCR